MHDPVTAAALPQLLNQFSVPMFAVERGNTSDIFRFVSVNEAMSLAVGRSLRGSIGRSAFDVLSADEAQLADDRFLECAAARGDLRYRAEFTIAGRKTLWDVTLQYVTLGNGAERVLGTSIQLDTAAPASPQVSSLEDINYISTMADFQLQNLVTLFETYRSQELFRPEAAPRVAKLGGMCRSIQQAVIDIKKIADRAQQQARPAQLDGANAGIRTADPMQHNSDIVRAMVAYSTDQKPIG